MYSLIVIIFILGYLAIAFEHTIKVNKAASALVTGVVTWTLYVMAGESHHHVNEELLHHLSEISGILFFLLGAMTIVELVDSHNGFEIITRRITIERNPGLLWIVSSLTFVLSAILDNLTTTIVMISLLRKLINDKNQRLFFAGIIVIAANAGGAWSPIGDVTTTMLWIGGQITTIHIIKSIIVPSLVCMVIPLLVVSIRMRGHVPRPEILLDESTKVEKREQQIVFFSGVSALIFVPIFKTLTHLPPFMGMMLSLGLMWTLTEILHHKKAESLRDRYSVLYALRKIDTSSILFFLGILLCIGTLEATGLLQSAAAWLSGQIQSEALIIMIIGLLSSIVDNVPLVAASMGMYDLTQYPTDSFFWTFLAYCAGTGGSALIIGSAAGVAAMGIEKINFMWYLKKIAWLAVVGYFAGAFTYLLQYELFGF